MDVEVFPQFGNTALLLKVDSSSLPTNVKAFIVPPGAFFTSATQSKVLRMIVLVLPHSPGSVGQMRINLSQFYPPQGHDSHTINGPLLQLSPFISHFESDPEIAAAFAEAQTASARAIVTALPLGMVTAAGHKTALGDVLTQAMEQILNGDIAEAIVTLSQAIERTDGCVLRGSPDGNDPGRDWITDCAAQFQVYDLLNGALDALTP